MEELDLRIFWLLCRSPGARLSHGRSAVNPKAVYTDFVKGELVAAGVVPETWLAKRVREWAATADLDCAGCVAGAVLMKPSCVQSVTSVLAGPQRALADFWLATRYSDVTLAFLEVVDVVAFQPPVEVSRGDGYEVPRALATRLSPFSVERLLATQTAPGGRSAGEVLAQWAAVCGRAPGRGAAPGFMEALVGLAPHIRLITSGRWRSWALPLAGGNVGSALGLTLLGGWPVVPPRGARQGWPDRAGEGAQIELLWSPAFLQGVADSLRTCAAGDPVPPDRLRILARRLQEARSALLLDSWANSRRAYDMERMVSSVLGASHLLGTARYLESLRYAILSVTSLPGLQDHLLNLLLVRPSPSQWTLRRHRLTLHIAFCRVQADQYEELLSKPGGVVCYRMVDSSPQFGYDWVLNGLRVVPVEALPRALADANALCAEGLPDEARDDALARLAALMRLAPGVPAAVGSGKSSVARKAHAVCHAQRLTASSWASAAALLRSTVAWTGDLGTESSFWRFCSSWPRLFGPWARDSGADDNDREDAAAGDEDVEFDWQGAAGSWEDDAEFAFDFGEDPPAGPAGDGAGPIAPLGPPGSVAPLGPAAADPGSLDFRASLFIPGLLHIIHNTTSDLAGALQNWSKFIDQLRHITRLLSRRWSRDRLKESCFPAGPWRLIWEGAGFDTFAASVYDGRWGSVLAAVRSLLGVERALRGAWSKEAYLGKGGVEADRGDGNGLNVAAADAGIASAGFWGYARMVDTVGEVLRDVQVWAEGCTCHDGRPELRGPTRHRRSAAMAEQVGVEACPLRTMRAPECAAGRLHEMLELSLQTGHAHVLLDPGLADATEEDRGVIMADFARARAYLVAAFRLRLSFWRQLPWILCGLGHWRAEVARACAQRALDLYPAATREVAGHVLVVAACDPSGPGRMQMELFAEGAAELSDCPVIEGLAARLRFAGVAERWIEGEHARAKRAMNKAPHLSAAHVAFYSALPALREALHGSRDVIERFAVYCRRVRNPMLAVQASGFEHHPAVQELVRTTRDSHMNRKHHAELARILYHVDSRSLHGPLPAEEDDDGGAGGGGGGAGPAQEGDPPEAPALHGGAGGYHYDRLWAKAAVDALLELAAERLTDASLPPLAFSIGAATATADPAAFAKPLRDIVDPLPEGSLAAISFDFAGDPAESTAEDGPAAPDDRGVIFFDIVRGRAGRTKVPRLAPQAATSDVCVRLFTAVRIDDARKEVQVQLESEGGAGPKDVHVLALHRLTAEDFRFLIAWDVRVNLVHDLGPTMPANLAAAHDRVVPRLCRGAVGPAGSGGLAAVTVPFAEDPDGEEDMVLQILESHGLVENTSGDAFSKTWRLTAAGQRSLKLRQVLHNPRRADTLHELRPVGEAGPHQLFRMLADGGWVCAVAPAGRRGSGDRAGGLVDYTPGGEKRWYLKGVEATLPVFYVRALLCAERLGRAVPHLRGERFYEALLDGRAPEVAMRFRFAAAEGARRLPRQPPRRRPRVAAVAAAGSADESPAQPAQDAESSESGSAAGAGGRPSSSAAARSARSSSGSASSSSSSAPSAASGSPASGTSSESDVAPAAAAAPQAPGLVAASAPAAAAAAPAPAGPAGPLPDTTTWQTFKFTPVRGASGEPVGWEVRCPAHRGACSRTLRFQRHGGREVTERKLKWWCRAAFDAGVESRERHMALPHSPDGGLPSLAELAEWRPPAAHLEGVSALAARRALRFGAMA